VIDIAIVAVVLASAAVSFVRGFFREAMSLLSWIAAILITLTFTSRFASLLPRDAITSPTARAAISALVLFLGTLLVFAVANFLFRRIIASVQRGWTDRLVGVVFGIGRGVIIVALMVLAANLSPALKQESWWQASRLLPEFQKMAAAIHRQLPQEVAQHFDFRAVAS